MLCRTERPAGIQTDDAPRRMVSQALSLPKLAHVPFIRVARDQFRIAGEVAAAEVLGEPQIVVDHRMRFVAVMGRKRIGEQPAAPFAGETDTPPGPRNPGPQGAARRIRKEYRQIESLGSQSAGELPSPRAAIGMARRSRARPRIMEQKSIDEI